MDIMDSWNPFFIHLQMSNSLQILQKLLSRYQYNVQVFSEVCLIRGRFLRQKTVSHITDKMIDFLYVYIKEVAVKIYMKVLCRLYYSCLAPLEFSEIFPYRGKLYWTITVYVCQVFVSHSSVCVDQATIILITYGS